MAVENLTLSIPKGECFGFLGVNGAGKTTTFRMLTGDLAPSSGDVQLLSYSVSKGGRLVQKNVGYCPQFDALFHELTPTEHLQLYAKIRGITTSAQKRAVNNALAMLDLIQYREQPVCTLSGGNRRKLSAAIALIGEPQLLILDEPTTGMDPYTRRFLWNVIQRIVEQGVSVVFSSHSMEECEVLCSRLSIMVDGRLRCLGSIQHLKNKFGNRYTIRVVLESSDTRQSAIQYLHCHLTGAKLKHGGATTLVFEMLLNSEQLASVFQQLEEVPQTLGVSTYSVNQNTLDNVFIKFAAEKEQQVVATAMAEEQSSLDNFGMSAVSHTDDDEPLLRLSHSSSLNTDDHLLEV